MTALVSFPRSLRRCSATTEFILREISPEALLEGVKLTRSDLYVRTLRVATGAHFLSFVRGSDASGPTLGEELERLPSSAELVINVDGLDIDGALAVAAVLGESDHLRESSGRIILVCEEASIRRVFELLRLDQQVLIEHSLDDAFRDVISRAWLRESA